MLGNSIACHMLKIMNYEACKIMVTDLFLIRWES